MEWTIYLDIDGVLADFIGGVGNLFNRPDLVENWPQPKDGRHIYEVGEALGIHEHNIWSEIDYEGEHFWMGLSVYPWTRTVYEACARYGQVFLVTMPSHVGVSYLGKHLWIGTKLYRMLGELPGLSDRVIMTRAPKSLLSRPGTILVDDNEANCVDFVGDGTRGHAILFPQPWNSNRLWGITAKERVDFLNERLAEITSEPIDQKLDNRLVKEQMKDPGAAQGVINQVQGG